MKLLYAKAEKLVQPMLLIALSRASEELQLPLDSLFALLRSSLG